MNTIIKTIKFAGAALTVIAAGFALTLLPESFYENVGRFSIVIATGVAIAMAYNSKGTK